MWVEEGQRQAGRQNRPQRGRGRLARRQGGRVGRAAGGHQAVADQERRAGVPREGGEVGISGDQRADPGDTRNDQEEIRYGAQRHHGQHMLIAHALAKHEGVLGADGDDQAQ